MSAWHEPVWATATLRTDKRRKACLGRNAHMIFAQSATPLHIVQGSDRVSTMTWTVARRLATAVAARDSEAES